MLPSASTLSSYPASETVHCLSSFNRRGLRRSAAACRGCTKSGWGLSEGLCKWHGLMVPEFLTDPSDEFRRLDQSTIRNEINRRKRRGLP
jgi:hypothetical protein